MSESVKARLENLEAKAEADGERCPHCGRLCGDEAERQRLNLKAGITFDHDEYARLYRERMERSDAQIAERFIDREIAAGRLIRMGGES
ncbi:MAG: hypothetical protein ABSB74_10060 [Tepidisphaeraceae bacterium]